jgi:hypothetical protein
MSIVMKSICLVLIVSVFAAGTAFAQDVNPAQIRQLTKADPLTAKSPNTSVRPSYLLPPQDQPAAKDATQSSGTSHKKRNIIIGVVSALVVGGVIVAAHNGAYGSSGMGY